MLNNLLVHSCNVNRPTNSKDASGGIAQTFAVAYTGLACSIQPISAAWIIHYAQKEIEVSHVFYFGSNPTIHNGDELTYNGNTYQVKGIRDFVTLGRVLAVDALLSL